MKVGLGKSLVIAALVTGGIAASYLGFHQPSPAPERPSGATNGSTASAHVEAPISSAAATESAAPTQPAPASSVAAILPSSASNADKRAATSASAGSTGGLERELSLLQRAHAAYRAGQPALALQLAREEAKSFPHSQLAAEGQTIQVLSLCALGRTREARAVADRLRAASGSPSLSGLAGSCVSP